MGGNKIKEIMLVKESLNFERELNSKKALNTGINSEWGKKERANTLKEKIGHIAENAMPKVIDKIEDYENCIDNLEAQGISLKGISIVMEKAVFSFPSWRCILGNTVSHICISEEDANKLMGYINKYDPSRDPEYNYIELDNIGTYMNIDQLKEFFARRWGKWIN
jgi:hypothetical protein